MIACGQFLGMNYKDNQTRLYLCVVLVAYNGTTYYKNFTVLRIVLPTPQN